MDHCANAVLAEDVPKQLWIAGIAFIEGDVCGDQVAASFRKVVKDHHRARNLAASQHGMAADVASPPGNQDRIVSHCGSLSKIPMERGAASNPTAWQRPATERS